MRGGDGEKKVVKGKMDVLGRGRKDMEKSFSRELGTLRAFS